MFIAGRALVLIRCGTFLSIGCGALFLIVSGALLLIVSGAHIFVACAALLIIRRHSLVLGVALFVRDMVALQRDIVAMLRHIATKYSRNKQQLRNINENT